MAPEIVVEPPHALGDGLAGGKEIFGYGTNLVFPVNSFNATNYWVEVWFPVGSVHNYLHPKPEIISNPKTIAATSNNRSMASSQGSNRWIRLLSRAAARICW